MPQSTLLTFFKPKTSSLLSLTQSNGFDDSLPPSQVASKCSLGPERPSIEVNSSNLPPDVLGSQWPLDIKPYPTPNPSLKIYPVNPKSIAHLQRLTTALLPVKYPQTFFDDVLTHEITKYLSRQVVYMSNVPDEPSSPVGWIRCRLEVFPNAKPTEPLSLDSIDDELETRSTQIYIQALCMLAPYRGYGAATALLESILADKDLLLRWGVKGVSAHVWQANEDALEWYAKRGFKHTVLVDGYYRKLKPSAAWLVWLPLNMVSIG